jgi:hypothetical protein
MLPTNSGYGKQSPWVQKVLTFIDAASRFLEAGFPAVVVATRRGRGDAFEEQTSLGDRLRRGDDVVLLSDDDPVLAGCSPVDPLQLPSGSTDHLGGGSRSVLVSEVEVVDPVPRSIETASLRYLFQKSIVA